MAEPASVWKLVLEDLQVTLSPATFTSWVKPLDLANITETETGRLIADINCPSSFHQNIIEQRFYGQIQEALNRVTNSRCELRFTIAPLTSSTPLKNTDANLFNELEKTLLNKSSSRPIA